MQALKLEATIIAADEESRGGRHCTGHKQIYRRRVTTRSHRGEKIVEKALLFKGVLSSPYFLGYSIPT
jgi:hypothetical protein